MASFKVILFMCNNHLPPALWFVRMSNQSVQVEDSIIPLLSPSESIRLNRLSHPNKRREFLLSRAMIRYALTYSFPDIADDLTFAEGRRLNPQSKNLPHQISTSLSHSKGLICFAIAHNTIGVDVEQLNQARNLIESASLFMSKNELIQFHNHKSRKTDFFYRVWSQKEAYFKTLSTKQQNKFNARAFSIDDIAINNQYSVFNGTYKNFAVALMIEGLHQRIKHNILEVAAEGFIHSQQTALN